MEASKMKKVFIVTGEASGDKLASKVISNLNKLSSLNSDKSNFNHVLKSKKIFLVGVGILIFVIGLIFYFL